MQLCEFSLFNKSPMTVPVNMKGWSQTGDLSRIRCFQVAWRKKLFVHRRNLVHFTHFSSICLSPQHVPDVSYLLWFFPISGTHKTHFKYVVKCGCRWIAAIHSRVHAKEISASDGGLKTNISSVQCSMFIHYKWKMLNCFQFMWLQKRDLSRRIQSSKAEYIFFIFDYIVTSELGQQLFIPTENKLQTFRTHVMQSFTQKSIAICAR